MGERKREIDRHTVYAALVAALGVGLFWWMFYQVGFSSGRHEERAHIEREHYAADAAEQLTNSCTRLPPTAAAKCGYQVADTEREGSRSESDLAAQWKAADWVFWAGILGGAQLIVTAVGLFFIKRTLDANWGAVDAAVLASQHMERQNELTQIAQRPWIKLRAYVSKVEVDLDGEIALCVGVEATNIGKSVALDVGMWVIIDQTHTLSERALENTRKKAAERERGQGVPLVPGDKQSHWTEIVTGIDEGKLIGPENGRLAPFKFFAAVAYMVPGDPEMKVSEKGFLVTEEESPDRFKPQGIKHPVRLDLKAEDLHTMTIGLVRAT